MLKKLIIIIFTTVLLSFSANAGSDGKLELNKSPSTEKKTKDCFEKLNRATFAFNQSLDKAVIKPIAKRFSVTVDRLIII